MSKMCEIEAWNVRTSVQVTQKKRVDMGNVFDRNKQACLQNYTKESYLGYLYSTKC